MDMKSTAKTQMSSLDFVRDKKFNTFLDREHKYDFVDNVEPFYKAKKGLSEKIVREISEQKKEDNWIKKKRLEALKCFDHMPIPPFKSLSSLNLSDLYYYLRPVAKKAKSWSQVSPTLKSTFEKLGIPEAERKYLAGVETQYDSEVIYGSLKEHLSKKGVIFTDTDSALKKYPEIFKEYFGSVVPFSDNKFAALNTAVWSGGSFIYIPKGVKVDLPLQAYFRINAKNLGQFERTLIIADENSFVHYIEGCTAPSFSTASLHAGVVEIIVKKGARVRYTTIQNWSKNVFNLVTKRAHVYEEGLMEWVDGNLGSKVTMKYPSFYLLGPKAKGELLSISLAGKGQIQDAGGKAIHISSETTSKIVSKSISKDGGRAIYRGVVQINQEAKNCRSNVKCDGLIMNNFSRNDTYPTIRVNNSSSILEHEASVFKISEEQLFYLMSRGISKEDATSMIVNGFIEPIVKELPMEYAVELNRLIQMEMGV